MSETWLLVRPRRKFDPMVDVQGKDVQGKDFQGKDVQGKDVLARICIKRVNGIECDLILEDFNGSVEQERDVITGRSTIVFTFSDCKISSGSPTDVLSKIFGGGTVDVLEDMERRVMDGAGDIAQRLSEAKLYKRVLSAKIDTLEKLIQQIEEGEE